MKQVLISIFCLLMAACTPEQQPVHVSLSADKTSLDFPAEGGEQIVMVTVSEKLYISADLWMTIKREQQSDSIVAVTFTASANADSKERAAKVALVAGEEKVYIDVKQAAANGNSGMPSPDGSAAWKMAEKFALGWNLGNQMDAHNDGISSETAWGNPRASQTTFTRVKEAGFSTVRIPVTWLGHIGEAPEYKIDEAWLNRVAELVGYAENAGLNAVINMHHDGADSKHWLDIMNAALDADKQAQILEQIDAMWTQIAEKFKDKGDFLMFEAFNEIHDGGWGWGANKSDGGKQYKCMNEWNQKFVDAVRATGGNNAARILGVPAYCTNIDIAIESFVMPEDAAEGRLMLSVHSYDPSDYALTAKKSEWGHTADNAKKPSGDNELQIKTMFEKIYANFISKGIPVYMGEFGCVNRATEREQAFQQYYLKYYTKAAQTYGVPCFIWDNGATGSGEEKHAFFNHANGEFSSLEAEAAITAMVSAYNSDDTLDDIYDQAPAK